jgi:hypothetical protein
MSLNASGVYTLVFLDCLLASFNPAVRAQVAKDEPTFYVLFFLIKSFFPRNLKLRLPSNLPQG